MREDGRKFDELRNLEIIPDVMKYADGSAEVRWGNNRVLCSASWEPRVPPWMKGQGKGWITAEYGMLPRSAPQRIQRDINRLRKSPRSVEIQRLIGRVIRSVVDLKKMGENTMTIDCDVIQADGGTRVASIVGGFVALVQAFRSINNGMVPIKDYLGAVSLGIVNNQVMLDLCYEEDFRAEADMNIAVTGAGEIVEIQVTAEKKPFPLETFNSMVKVGMKGIMEILEIQKKVLGEL
jgi:ribonuclease PH